MLRFYDHDTQNVAPKTSFSFLVSGNKEDGYLFGIDNLVSILESVHEQSLLRERQESAATKNIRRNNSALT